MAAPVTRFAPSPTGALHLGHAASALAAWEAARAGGGRFLLRIEDIDAGRCRPEYADWVTEDLAWLGLHWDGEVRVQSMHMAEYAMALARLEADGLVYPCFCTRAAAAREMAAAGGAPHGPDGGLAYPGTCRGLSRAEREQRVAAGEAHAVRLDMAEAVRRTGPLTWLEAKMGRMPCDPAAFGDVVLGRKDVLASYHLCVTHDDAVQGVTVVTRGVDLRPVTSVHRVLQSLLGWPEPLYRHHPLVLGTDGRRLAKRDGAVAVRALRAAGLSADDVVRLARTSPGGGPASGTR